MAALAPQPIGQSDAFMAVLDRVSDLAVIEKPILVVGAHGTGKELMASRLHFLSPRWEQVYVSVNCAAYSEAELDTELFGSSDRDGQFFEANGGTLFLDNIQAVSLRLQEKLIRAIEYGRFESRGRASQDIDVRVIAATHIDLPEAVKAGAFRADLLYSLAFDVLTLPPLRARADDIMALTEHFGKKIAAELGAPSFPGVSAEAAQTLMGHSWTGNIRELKSVIERSTARAWFLDESLTAPISDLIFNPFSGAYLSDDSEAPSDLTIEAAQKETEDSSVSTKPFAERVMIFERGLIDEAMRVSDHHQGRAAKHMGLTYHQFRGLLRKHGLKK